MKTAPPETLHRVRRFLAAHPWAIVPAALDAVLEVVERRVAGVELTDEEVQERLGAARRLPRQSATPGAIAVLPIHGVIAPRMNMLTDVSGGTSTEELGRAFDAALADPAVSAIVLDVDSPGGSVHGLEELATRIHAARGVKPVVAVANFQAASAAYYLASQAGELVVSPSGEVGSIGTLAVHTDVSGYNEKLGVRRSYVTAGRYKAEGNPDAPLGDEARAEIQRMVDHFYEQFVAAVARGRGVSRAAVREKFGEGRMVLAEDAVARGMADRIETIDQVLARLAGRAARAAGARAEVEPVTFAAEQTDQGDGISKTAAPGSELTAEAPAGDTDRLRLELARARQRGLEQGA